jgi:hypothetical protein
MIAPELKQALESGEWWYKLAPIVTKNAGAITEADAPELGELLRLNTDGSLVLNTISETNPSIPKSAIIRAAHQLRFPELGNLEHVFNNATKEELDQLADEGIVLSSRMGLDGFPPGLMRSHKYTTKSLIKMLEKEGEIPYNSLKGLQNLFLDEVGTDNDKKELANGILKASEKVNWLPHDSVPAFEYLLKNHPNDLSKVTKLPNAPPSQKLIDGAIDYAKNTPNPDLQLLNWAINNPTRISHLSLYNEGERLLSKGLSIDNILRFSKHGIPFQKILELKPQSGASIERALEGASYKDGDEDGLYQILADLTGTGNHKDIVERLLLLDHNKNRTGLTKMLENITQKYGGMDYKELVLHKNPGKYNLSDSQQEGLADYLSNPVYATSVQPEKILQMQGLKPSVVSRIMRVFSQNIKEKKHVIENGSIPYGANHFSNRSLSSEGHYTGDDSSLHPNDVLDVRVGSSVLRKLRDHLEKAGQIRPEDLPKGESWNSILKPITDKSGNVNYIPDWNPLRSANGKLDSAKVQQYIDSMPARRVVLSYSTWSHPLQRHSKAKSNVLIANLSPDTIEKLKQENLYGKFLEKTVSDVNTIHPLGRDSIGWIRFTGDHKKGFHVDEVQSDLYGDLRKSTDPDHKRIAEIVFGDAHPSEILHEVAQEYFRKNPKNIGAPWATHTVASKSPMALEEAKEAPVHFKVSYEQAPKRMGAKPSTYGTLRTQTGDNPKYADKYALQGKPTWQDEVRKFDEVEGEDLLLKATKKTKTPAPEASPSVQEEPKDLVVLHNLREAGLHHADEIGGLPAPSIAVAKVDHPLTNFGDVSLVGHHSMIDPKDTPVFDADVYSPRWPRVGHTLDSKKLSQFHQQMGPLNREIGGFGINDDEIEKSGENAIDSRGIRYPLAVAFLREQGHDFKPHMKESANLSGHEYLNTPVVHQFFKENKMPSHVYDWKYEVPHMAEEFKKILPTAIRQMYGKLDNGKLDAVTKSALEQKINEAIEDLKEYAMDETKDSIGGLSPHYLRAIMHLYPNIGKTEPDGYKNQDALDQKIKEIGEEKFSEWAKNKIRPLIKDKHIVRFTKSGTKKKLPYTLVNLLNELTSTIRGGEGFNYGLGTARSHGAAQFKDLSHMANSRHKIVSKEDFQKQKEDMDNRFDAIADLVSRSGSSSPGFRVMGGLAEAIGSYYRNKQMGRSLSSAGFSGISTGVVNQIKQFADDLRNMPTEYFEAKPQRIVDLSEFKGAAVPHDASEKTLEILRRNGINHVERYDRYNEDARREAIRRIAQGNDLLLNETEYTNLIKSFAKNEVKKAFKHEVSEGILSQSKQLVKSEDRKMVIRKAIVTTFQKLQKAIAKQMLYPEKDPVVLDDLLRIKTLGHNTPEHALDSFVQHEEPAVRVSAIHELPLKDHHLHTLVNDADPTVAKQAVRSSKAQEGHLLAALERPDHDLHALVAMHANATENTLHRVLEGEHPLDVKLAAVQNPKNDLPALMGAARRYTEATDDSPEAEILTEILSHPHADQPLYQSVLHGNFPSTAKAIAASKLIDDTHLTNALTHPDELVALGAVASPKARSGHYHHANSDSVKKAIAMKFGGAV